MAEGAFTVDKWGPVIELREDGRWYRNGELLGEEEAAKYAAALSPMEEFVGKGPHSDLCPGCGRELEFLCGCGEWRSVKWAFTLVGKQLRCTSCGWRRG